MAENTELLPVVCRHNPRLTGFVVLGFFEAIFMIVAPFWAREEMPVSRPIWPLLVICWPMAALILCGISYIALEIARGEIRADAAGLHWRRGFATWKSATWEQISDFYLGGMGPHPTTKTIETPAGQLELDRAYSNIEIVAELVENRAVNAPARAWEMRGFRRGETWSSSLSLWSKTQQWFAPVLSFALIGCPVALMLMPDSTPRRTAPISMGLGWNIALIALALLFFVPVGFAMILSLLLMWRERTFAWLHRHETLQLSASGLIYRDGQTRIEASWEQVRAVERLPRARLGTSYRVTTDAGNFTLWSLSNSSMWRGFRAPCQSYAPAALEQLITDETRELLDDELVAPSEAKAPIFTFRTRGNRLILVCVSCVLVFAPLFYLIGGYSRFDPDAPFAPNWPLFCGAYFIVVVILGALWTWFRRARIIADDEGLELRSPLRRARRFLWTEIEAMGHDVWGDWLRAGGRKIYFVFNLGLSPARREALEATVKRQSVTSNES